MQNDEWVVCRVFQKISGIKKLFMYADMPYQLTDSHSTLPGHRDSSPNPTVTDDGDCDTCTGNESCYNCEGGGVLAQAWVQVADSKLNAMGNNSNVAMAASAMDMSNLMKDSYYTDQTNNNNNNSNSLAAMNAATMGRFGTTAMPPTYPLTPVKAFDRHGNRMRATKVEPFFTTACEGEDEAQSSQRLNLDYSWPGDNVLYQEFPCDSPLTPLPTATGESSGGAQSTSCLSDGTFGDEQQQIRMFSRMAMRGSFPGLPEMSGPIDGLQELGWAY